MQVMPNTFIPELRTNDINNEIQFKNPQIATQDFDEMHFCRSHLKIFFESKSRSYKSQNRRNKWTSSDDEKLKKAVSQHGERNWCAISRLIPGKNAKQCRERWNSHLNPQLSTKSWTINEDQTLLQLHYIYGNQWSTIALFLPGRCGNSVKNRYNWLERRQLSKSNKFTFNPSIQFTTVQSLPNLRPNLFQPLSNFFNDTTKRSIVNPNINIAKTPPQQNQTEIYSDPDFHVIFDDVDIINFINEESQLLTGFDQTTDLQFDFIE